MADLLRDLSPPALGSAVEENAVALWRSWASWKRAEFREEPHRSFVACAVPHPAFNHLFRIRIDPRNAEKMISESLDPFRRRRTPFLCWIEPAAAHPLRVRLEEASLSYAFTAPGMAVSLDRLPGEDSAAEGIVISEVLDEDALKSWCHVISEGSEFSREASEAWRELHDTIPFGPGRRRRHFLARRDDVPVGTSSLLFAAGVAGLYSVVVLREHRRRGIGGILSLAALKAARGEGRQVGVLVSTKMGTGIYRRLGFREFRRWECWHWAPA